MEETFYKVFNDSKHPEPTYTRSSSNLCYKVVFLQIVATTEIFGINKH